MNFRNTAGNETHLASGSNHSTLPIRLCLWLSLLAGLSVPALAVTFKGVMGEMKQTTTAAKGMLSNFDQTKADALLRQYATQALAADKLYGDAASAKAADFHKRFTALATTAANAKGVDAAGFRKAFLAISAQCRSCHAAYN